MQPYSGKLKPVLMTACMLLFIYSAIAQKTPVLRLSVADSSMIETYLFQMTLEEKVGQLSLFSSDWAVTGPMPDKKYIQLIREGKVGAIFNTYTVDNVRALQKMAVEESRLKIPLIFGFDVIHGHRTIFPIPLGQASSWDLKAIEKAEQIAALEATADGLNWTFAPMVDVARDPRWGRVSEGAGEDTWLGCRIAEARVRGFQGSTYGDGRHILACVKHFAAYGAPIAGREYNTVDISLVSLYETYLPTYKAGFDAGAASVMTSFNEINGIPSTGNRWLLTDLLRKEWGFRGFVVTDYLSINQMVNHGVAADVKAAASISLNAGVDMDMQGSAFLNYLPALLKNKEVNIQQIDEAVRRILRAKVQLGLFEDPYRYCNKKREKEDIMTQESLDFARKFVSESSVLLKNSDRTLPVPSSVRTIAVIGPLGDSRKEMMGNWTAAGKGEQCVSLLDGIRNKCGDKVRVIYEKGCAINDNELSGIDAAVKAAGEADFVLLALGEGGDMSGEAASRTNIDLPGVQNQLAAAVMKAGKPTAVVLFNGRPLAISYLNDIAPAILETWFGGTQAGNGIADVLFGEVNPSGKLTMSFPRNVGQIPIFYNAKNTGRPFNPTDPRDKYVSKYLDCPNTPLYPFGYGLSYTSFSYAGMKATVKRDEIMITAMVTNTGERDGEEIVQLYIQDKVGSITRPLKELKGYKKLMIKKGETVKVSFTLTADELSFYHPDLKKSWEPGEFNAFVGGSSAELISAPFKL